MPVPRRALVVAGTLLLSVLLYVDRVCISTASLPHGAATLVALDRKRGDTENEAKRHLTEADFGDR